MKILILIAVVLCVGLAVYIYVRDPVVRQDVRDVGSGIERGAKDAVNDTKDAVKKVVE